MQAKHSFLSRNTLQDIRAHALTRAEPHEQGQAAVEFALTIGIFVLLFVGTIGMAMVFFAWLTTTSAAREGARRFVQDRAVAHSTVITHICATSFMLGGSPENCQSQVDAGELVIAIDPTTVPKLSNSRVTVTVRFHVPVPTLRASFFNGGGITFLGPIWVESKSLMWLE